MHLQIALQAQARQRELVEQAGPLLKGIRVLVVDDNEVSREILAEMLRFFQLDVDTAPNGPAALAALQAAADNPYDLVLMDWRMPGMNGDEATQRIHRDAAIPRQPKVVMVTAYGREDVIRLAEQAGVDGFLDQAGVALDAARHDSFGAGTWAHFRRRRQAPRANRRILRSAASWPARACCWSRTTTSTANSPPNCCAAKASRSMRR